MNRIIRRPFLLQLEHSNATQVMLRRVGYNLGGNVSCEVTTDRQFKTASAYDILEVVIIPPEPPVVKVNLERYHPGDRLFGNCTYNSSKPPAKLRLLITNNLVSSIRSVGVLTKFLINVHGNGKKVDSIGINIL